ncbi:hypothetical protein [Hydrocarboniphaga sp.]|uniref:hypothetical protein n=1 Tax=Hydrocarboniphaga sp. TaxID=2033016 RepID=UPI003D09999D
MSEFRIVSLSELRRRQWLGRAHVAALIGLGWLAATLLSEARDPAPPAQTSLDRAVAREQLQAVSAPQPSASPCPQLSRSGLRMDCSLSLAPQS